MFVRLVSINKLCWTDHVGLLRRLQAETRPFVDMLKIVPQSDIPAFPSAGCTLDENSESDLWLVNVLGFKEILCSH